jgi:hypothetical protein
LFFICLPADAQQLVQVRGSYDTAAVTELYNTTPVGIQLVYSDSSTRQTTGLLRGDYRWNKLDISSSNGKIQNGVLYFNRRQLAKDNYRITFTVSNGNNGSLQTTITLPHVIRIRFNHYADSIKRDIRFYLNVEGKFSSGKVFPLDTSAVRFAASHGEKLGQDLQLPKNDTAKTVTVEAWYRHNNQMYLRSVIPVKQAPDNDSLIIKNPQELFRKKRRQ